MLLQYVDHLSREFTYPIIADPVFLVPLLTTVGRIVIQRVVVAVASQAARAAVSALARTGVSAVVRKNLLSITQSNYRNNLMIHTQRDPGGNCHAHHTLPQNRRKDFVKIGFTGNDSIDHPKYLVWWEKKDHLSKSPSITKSWNTWFARTASPSKQQVLKKRTDVLRQYPPRCP